MNKRSRQFLTVLMCAAIFSNSACSTTTQRLGPTQAAMNNYGIGKGDTVLIRYANEGNTRTSSSSELVKITNITSTGVSGVGQNGIAVDAVYDEIFQIEHKTLRRKRVDEMPLLESALNVTLCVLMALVQAGC